MKTKYIAMFIFALIALTSPAFAQDRQVPQAPPNPNVEQEDPKGPAKPTTSTVKRTGGDDGDVLPSTPPGVKVEKTGESVAKNGDIIQFYTGTGESTTKGTKDFGKSGSVTYVVVGAIVSAPTEFPTTSLKEKGTFHQHDESFASRAIVATNSSGKSEVVKPTFLPGNPRTGDAADSTHRVWFQGIFDSLVQDEGWVISWEVDGLAKRGGADVRVFIRSEADVPSTVKRLDPEKVDLVPSGVSRERVIGSRNPAVLQ